MKKTCIYIYIIRGTYILEHIYIYIYLHVCIVRTAKAAKLVIDLNKEGKLHAADS
jgi:hypothetical protein